MKARTLHVGLTIFSCTCLTARIAMWRLSMRCVVQLLRFAAWLRPGEAGVRRLSCLPPAPSSGCSPDDDRAYAAGHLLVGIVVLIAIIAICVAFGLA